MKTKNLFAMFAVVLSSSILNLLAGDGFESVRCGGDIVKALRGRQTSNQRVVVLEARHKDLGLKDLGAEFVSDDEHLSLIFWLICGDEYAVLEDDKNFVHDALKFPKHSKDEPQFVGSCQSNGHDLPGVVVGVLKHEESAGALAAVKVWKIDEKEKKFVDLPTAGLRCGPDGISSQDSER
jgi:hypothetical protein